MIKRSNLPSLLLVPASVLVVLLLLEALLRLLDFNPFGEFFETEGRAVFLQPSANTTRVYEAVPGASGRGWGTEITINRHGFRGEEIPLKKPADATRIAVLGDSISFGNNLLPSQNFPALLQARFDQQGKKVDVMNFALGGYDVLQAVATLDEALALSPDLVVLGYCVNDITIASGNLNYINRLQKYGRSPIYHSRLAQWIRIQMDRIELKHYNEAMGELGNFKARFKNQMADLNNDSQLHTLMTELEQTHELFAEPLPLARVYYSEPHLQRLRYALQYLQAQTAQKNIPVVVVIFPFLYPEEQHRPVYQLIDRIVQHESKRLGFAAVSLFEPLATQGMNNFWIKEDDWIHPNEEVHQLAADRILQQLEFMWKNSRKQ